MSADSGSERQATMFVDLGDEQVTLERFTLREALGEPFEMAVDIIAEHAELELLPHLGKEIKIKVMQGGDVRRLTHGIIVEAHYVDQAKSGWRYRLTVRPWTYFMDANIEYRIHQEKSVTDILQKTFQFAGVSDVDYSRLVKERVIRTYCVQYGESDFDFVSRLMEEEGIYYYWKHEADRHVMVLCEDRTSHQPGAIDSLEHQAQSDAGIASRTEDGGIVPFIVNLVESVRTSARAKVVVRDWDFERPQAPIETSVSSGEQHPRDAAEVYLGASKFVIGDKAKDEAVAKPLAASTLDAARSDRVTFSGMSQSLELATGTKVNIHGHNTERFNAEYLIVATHHSIVSEKMRSGDGEGGSTGYDVYFEAIPVATRFQPQIRTPRPVVRGLESAIVTGPPGEKIHTDEFGRVKVQFHWDRVGKKDDKSSCWIRVSQTGGLGNLILPRIGQEVLVDFLGGDPDRPVIVGRVFNAEHMPVYELPTHRNIATWRTESIGGPAAVGAAKPIKDERDLAVKKGAVESNEIRLEDTAGSEEFYMHANRDMNTRIRHKEMHRVGLDQEIYVGQNRTETVEKDEKVTIKGKRDYTLTGNETEIIEQGNRKTTLNQGNRDTTLKMGNDTLGVKMGNISVKADMGKIQIEAMQSIELKVGSSTVVIDQMGVTIKGMMIKSEAQVMSTTKGLMTTSEASAMMTVKGAITMIN